MEFQYEHQGKIYNLTLSQKNDHQFTATIGDRTIDFSAVQQQPNVWILTRGHQRIVAYVAQDGDMRYVHVNGNTITLSTIDERTQRRKQSKAGGDLTAQMPGQVVDVLVAVGDQVASGQTLVILEAMKMEIRVTAGKDGTVNGVFVQQGDVVQRGQRLIELT